MINNLSYDFGYISLNKFSETLCGDHVEVVYNNGILKVIVLADGLGSGVKANILSVLTSKTLSTMFANGLALEDCVKTIAKILPICQDRQIAYSTFSIIRIVDNEYAEIAEYDNPQMIILEAGKYFEPVRTSFLIEGKTIYTSKVKLMENQNFIMFSDGAIHAGVGMSLNFGWEREQIKEFLLKNYNVDYPAKTIAKILSDECNRLYGNAPGDDTTVVALRIIERTSVNLVFGPAEYVKDDSLMMALFFSKEGKHIVCGGTTANICARYLGKSVDTDIDFNSLDKNIPPTSRIEGVDLVTEGVITIAKVVSNCRDYLDTNSLYDYWNNHFDGASLITQKLINEATDINFYCGKAINPAHQNPDLQIDFSIKMKLVEELSDCLKQMGKSINVSYF